MMKKQFLIPAFTALSFFFTTPNVAQSGKRIPKWIPEHGFWVVESNVKTPGRSTICFYNNAGTLVYKEQVEGPRIKLDKKRVLLRLKNVLDHSITAWEATHIAKENENLLAARRKL